MRESVYKPTPLSTTCPACHEEGSLLIATEFSRYYRVTEIDKSHVKGTSTETANLVEGPRMFCSSCGQYFVVPDDYQLIG